MWCVFDDEFDCFLVVEVGVGDYCVVDMIFEGVVGIEYGGDVVLGLGG